MKKNTIKLNEDTLRQIVAKSIKGALSEKFEKVTAPNGIEFSVPDYNCPEDYMPSSKGASTKGKSAKGLKNEVESKLRKIVAESVKKVLREGVYGYDDPEILAEDLLNAFNYDTNTDTFNGLNEQQNNILNAVYAYLTTGGFESDGSFAHMDKNGNVLGRM